MQLIDILCFPFPCFVFLIFWTWFHPGCYIFFHVSVNILLEEDFMFEGYHWYGSGHTGQAGLGAWSWKSVFSFFLLLISISYCCCCLSYICFITSEHHMGHAHCTGIYISAGQGWTRGTGWRRDEARLGNDKDGTNRGGLVGILEWRMGFFLENWSVLYLDFLWILLVLYCIVFAARTDYDGAQVLEASGRPIWIFVLWILLKIVSLEIRRKCIKPHGCR